MKAFLAWLAALFARPAQAAAEVAPSPIAPPLSAVDRDVLIRTIWGEARGESEAGQAAVVHVVRNRVLARKTSAAVECQRPYQFSCWLESDPQSDRLRNLKRTDLGYLAIGPVVDRAWLAPDTVFGARHYYAPAGMAGGRPPAWAKPPGREVARIGGHVFFAGVA